MSNSPKNNSKILLVVGLIFLALSTGFYIYGNLIIGSSFLPTGLVFTIVGLMGKPK